MSRINCCHSRRSLTDDWFCAQNVWLKKIFDQNRLVCWSIVADEKPTLGPPFFGAFPSDRIRKATKNVNAHFLFHSSNSCKLLQGISGTFCRYNVKLSSVTQILTSEPNWITPHTKSSLTAYSCSGSQEIITFFGNWSCLECPALRPISRMSATDFCY